MEEIKKWIYCPTKLRGFQKHLLDELRKKYMVEIRENLFFEKISLRKKILSKIVRSRLADYFGIIQVILVKRRDGLVFSYNRFIRGSNYIINLENPTALYHYSLRRNKSFLGKLKIKKELENPKLKKIVCISKACYNTASELLNEEVNKDKLLQIYPYIKDKKICFKDLENKALAQELNLLFISSEFYLKSGKEILKYMKEMDSNLIKLRIITQTKNIKKEDLLQIKKDKRIELLEFNLSFKELEKIYIKSNILLHLTRQDSFGLVILEAMKYGIPCIGTNIYAISEMIEDGENGFLTKPKFLFFDDRNIPNPKVWNNRKETIYSEDTDEKIVEFLKEKVALYLENRKILFEHSKNSYLKSINTEFSSEKIKEKWFELLENSI